MLSPDNTIREGSMPDRTHLVARALAYGAAAIVTVALLLRLSGAPGADRVAIGLAVGWVVGLVIVLIALALLHRSGGGSSI